MRIATVLAIALFGTTCLAQTERAKAAIQHYQLNIPRQSLDMALKDLAQQTGLQIGRFSGRVDGSAQVGPVEGTQTPGEALTRLLRGTGLDYKVVSDTTIAVFNPKETPSTAVAEEPSQESEEGAGDKNWLGRFRVGQVDKEASASTEEADGHDGNPSSAAPEELGEIVVTAQRRKELLQDVPVSISVLSGAELDRSTFSGVTDALAQAPSIVTLPDFAGGNTTYSIRGVGSGSGANANGAGPLAYYIDGVPFGFVRSGFYPSDPSAYDLERVEVLYGPQGTLYGANALNGVIRVLTHEADPNNFEAKARATVSGTHGGGQSLAGDAAINVPLIEDRLGARFVVGARNDGGWVDAPYGDDVNDSKSNSYRLRLKALPSDTLALDLTVWRSENEADAPDLSDDDGRIGFGPNSPGQLRPQPSEENFTVYSFGVANEFSGFSLSSTTSYIDYHTQIRPDGRPASALNPLLDNRFDSKILTQEINLTSSLDGPWRWSAGVFYRDAKDDKLQYIVSPATLANLLVNDDFTDESQSYAIYGEAGRKLADDWHLAVGLRYFHDDQAMHINQSYPAVTAPPGGTALRTVPVGREFEATSEAVTPRVVLTWQPSDDHSFYASYSEGFRSGFAQQPRVFARFDFAPVEPDRLTNYEIGAKGSMSGVRISYEAAVYYLDWQDVQRAVLVIPDPVNQPGISATSVINGTSASGLGASFSLTARPIEGLELGGAFSWNDLTLDGTVLSGATVLGRAGDRLAISPEYTASLFASYAWDLGSGYSARFGADGNYLPSMLQNPPLSNPTDSNTVVNTRFTLETPHHWNASLFVDNLTDEYGSAARVVGVTEQWSPRMRPKTYGIQFEYRY